MSMAVRKSPASGRKVAGHRTRVGRERRARTRSRILAAALRVFADKGPDAPVIDDFIRAAGVARGTFYNYFPGTDELFEATSKWLEDDMIVSIEAEISRSKDPVERLATGVRLWLLRAADDGAWCSFVVRNRRRSPLVENRLATDLRNGQRKGAFSFPSVAVARDLTVGAVLEAMRRMAHERTPRTYVDDVTRIVLRGLGLSDTATEAALARPVPGLRRRAQTVP
jgi:AcrR family transcriptional regulator